MKLINYIFLLLFSSIILLMACDKQTPEPTEYIFLNNDFYESAVNKVVDLNILQNDNIKGKVEITVSEPIHGIIETKNGGLVFKYLPEQNFIGKDEFYYTVKNENGLMESATIQIDLKTDISYCDSILQANADVIRLDVNSKKIFLIDDLLENDTACTGGINVSTFSIVTPPDSGKVSVVGNSIQYTPPSSTYTGVDVMEYAFESKFNSLVGTSAKVYFAVGVEFEIE